MPTPTDEAPQSSQSPRAPAPAADAKDVELGLPPAAESSKGSKGSSTVNPITASTQVQAPEFTEGKKETDIEALKASAKQKLLKVQAEVQAKDPVKKGRCSLGTLAFSIVGLLGCVFLGIGCAQEDVWEILSCILVLGLSGYAVVFLGGDPCLLEAFRKQVNRFRRENLRFKETNEKLEGELQNLGTVTDDLEEVRKKMGDDIEAATKLLQNMQRFSALQTVSVVVNQFFAADWDGSGHVSGDEAQILVPQLSSLWVLVPHFDSERLLTHVKEYGMTLGQLSRLLDHIVADDCLGCEEELERILATRLPKQSSSRPDVLPSSGTEQAPRSGSPPAQLEELYEETAVQFTDSLRSWGQGMGGWAQGVATHFKSVKQEADAEALKPWFEVGPLTVWSPLHLGLMLSTVAGIVFAMASLVVLELTNIIGSLIGLSLAAGLMAASRLIEVLKALRGEVVFLKGQNDRLEVIHDDLAGKVSHLAKVKKGFQTLQAECGGNVHKAKELIQKSNTNTKMSAMAVITRFFKDADKNRNHTIDADEVDAFVKRLQLAFHSVEGFDTERIKAAATGMSVRELRSLVDIIVTVEQAPPEPEPVAPAPLGPFDSARTGMSEVGVVSDVGAGV